MVKKSVVIAIIKLAISKCYGKVRMLFFPRDNSLVSAGKSHSSGVRGLVLRCLLFNPEGSCSNRCVYAYFLKHSEAEGFHFFGTVRLPPFRVCDFSKIFRCPQRPLQFMLIFCNRTNVKKFPKGSFFQIFWHYDSLKFSFFVFFRNLFKVSKRSFNFFDILQNLRRSSLLQFSAL